MGSEKTVLWIFVTIFGAVFGYLPVLLFKADPLGAESIIGGMVGGLFGIWLWYKVGH